MRLGKRPARLYGYKLFLADYLDHRVLPVPPVNFGHDRLVSNFPMLKNDAVGDCVIAGGLHETQVWNAEMARTVPVSDACALKNYSAITGYDPALTQPDGSNPTDQGTDVQDAAKWRITKGLTDAAGGVHKISAYVYVDPRNIPELRIATYLFGAIGLGIDFPRSAMEQFDEGMPWSPVPGSPSEGGHYVPVLAWRHGYAVAVTWGKEQLITPQFIQQRADEAICYLSPEMLNGQHKTPEGFDLTALRADLAALEARQ